MLPSYLHHCITFTGSRIRSRMGGFYVALLSASLSLEVLHDQGMVGLPFSVTCTSFSGSRTTSKEGGCSVALLPTAPSLEVAHGQGRLGLLLLPC